MDPEMPDAPPTPESLAALYEQGRFHEDDGYYGILAESKDEVIAALQPDPHACDFQTLTALFPQRLKRLDPSDKRQVQNLMEYFPGVSVIVFVRGQVDRLISMQTYGQDSGHFLPLETSLPNGC